MTKVTYQQIANFRQNARNFLGQKSGQSKLQYALTKMLKRTESLQNDYVDQEQEIRVNLAKCEKDGTLIMDGNRYTYTKDGAVQLQKKLRELKDTEVEIEPYIATQIPDDLEPIWYEFFVPFVLEDKSQE